MQIILNGEKKVLDNPVTVAELLGNININKKRVAVERNLEIVPRSQYSETKLSEGDKIEIIHFIGGG